ncbi:glycerophosphodiester phosphodiesterase family protein [Polynucleobacter acidiphobus]|uniref:glycerophosphodiester phosphodiesterase family protein n=1 Tax=Polynucleobacter acidiphobus TaxID=556053 RepID=UPI000D3329CA|nr:glycerophosphodiester phosphodiesterase family protein [Polynucleobacter acidiphobus]
MIKKLILLILTGIFCSPIIGQEHQYGVRPFILIEAMPESPLKNKLSSCRNQLPKKSNFSIAHRGAPLQFPEHTLESNFAAYLMGAGIFECDVTFTKDKQLVCRHAQNDLHTTTNILLTPLANQCTKSFNPVSDKNPASAECRTSDITLTEFKTLKGKMDGFNRQAKDRAEFMKGTPSWRTDLYVNRGGTLLTHRESIELFKKFGGKFTPELKAPSVPMPYQGFSQEQYAQALIDEYKMMRIPARDVFPQSFNLNDILYWIRNEPEFGKQAVYLDDRYLLKNFNPAKPEELKPTMQELYQLGVRYIGPPIWVLLTLNDRNQIIPSEYAKVAKAAGLNIITWTLERDGPLVNGGAWYHQSIKGAINNDGQTFEVLDILAQQVGVKGVFSDWPATVTYYANCMGLQ